ncbi:4Fe-4S binding protein [Oscillospiraceae bacterium HV4-5-C5C]|nr:4Fe-4S binding protein [Oscillospiraceae bacterium HV4-5-C5C]
MAQHGDVAVRTDRCKGCGLCASFCPKQVLAVDPGKLSERGFPLCQVIQPDACIGCGFCYSVCPDLAISLTVEKDR